MESKKKRQQENEEIKKLMHGFGDLKNPNDATADLLEEFTQVNLVDLALKRAQRRDKSHREIQEDDILHFLQNDYKKYIRVIFIAKFHEMKKQINKKANYSEQQQVQIVSDLYKENLMENQDDL